MRARVAVAWLLCAACGGGADSLGLHAWLRVPGAQYIAGPMPRSSGGPPILQASISRPDVSPGLQDRSVDAALDANANGVLLGLDGDTGYWILPAGPPDPQQPDALTLDAPVAFSPQLPPGSFDLIVRASSSDGRVGEPFSIALQTQGQSMPPGAFAVTLSWDTESDLDLHVVEPDGTEIYWDHIASQTGLLDFDSNQSCQIDGRRRERVLWSAGAPSGHYLIRVDTPSLCSEAVAHWQVQAQLGGSVIGRAQGTSTSFDTRGAHGKGAGLLALQVDVP